MGTGLGGVQSGMEILSSIPIWAEAIAGQMPIAYARFPEQVFIGILYFDKTVFMQFELF